MRGNLKKLTIVAFVTLLSAMVLAAQDPQDKPAPGSHEKPSAAAQDKPSPDSQDKASTDSQDKSSDNPPWYSKVNPARLVKRYKSANDQLASDGHLEDKLGKQLRLQRILGEDEELQVVCANFKDLPACIAVLRLSKSLPVEFTCLKWNVTGVKPKNAADSCAGPAGGKAMALDQAIYLLKPNLVKPNVDEKTEARNALRKAHDDIHDASS